MTQKEADKLNALKAEAKRLWTLACEHDGITPTGSFVIFSNDNPYTEAHNAATDTFFKARKQIAANNRRRERHAAMKDLGLNRVKGNLGGVYYE